MSALQRTQIYLEAAQIEALDARARARGLTRSDLIREAIEAALKADRRPSLYDFIVANGPNPDAGVTQEAFRERRAHFEAAVESRAKRRRSSQ